MILTEKSTKFAKKILKYNPIPQSHTHADCLDDCKHYQDQKNSSNADIKPYLHVHDHRKQREIYEKSTQEKIQNMKAFKEEGNEHFKNKRFKEAAYFYNKIIIFADYTFPEQKKEQKEMDELLQSSNSNIGLTYIKINQPQQSQAYLLQALKGPSAKLIKKATYWLAKVYIQRGEFQKAIKCIEELSLNIIENQEEVKELENQFRRAEQAYKKRSKNVYSQMFSK